MTTVRVVQWNVQPVLVADDGDNLEPVHVDPLSIPGSRWEQFTAGGWREAIASVQAQIDAPRSPDAPL